ncbi:MAG: hypothetical protein U9N30_06650 [Campylobacterota bacterium]|nr:hypothetical protein [Campylobacterota bacterium]
MIKCKLKLLKQCSGVVLVATLNANAVSTHEHNTLEDTRQLMKDELTVHVEDEFMYPQVSENIIENTNHVFKEKIKRVQNFINKKSIEPKNVDIENPAIKKLFDTLFLTAPKNYYTINLRSFTSMHLAKRYIKKHKLSNRCIAILTKSNYAIVYYGIYPIRKDAINALKNLNKALWVNKPFLNRIKHAQHHFDTCMKESM